MEAREKEGELRREVDEIWVFFLPGGAADGDWKKKKGTRLVAAVPHELPERGKPTVRERKTSVGVFRGELAPASTNRRRRTRGGYKNKQNDCTEWAGYGQRYATWRRLPLASQAEWQKATAKFACGKLERQWDAGGYEKGIALILHQWFNQLQLGRRFFRASTCYEFLHFLELILRHSIVILMSSLLQQSQTQTLTNNPSISYS
ncbi:hypothetical protein LXL04_032332 [Taraxacum kok-saghyz]